MITDINQLPADSESAFVCADCMDLMARYPDGYFDIAIVDPPYGINIGNATMGAGGGVAPHKNRSAKNKLGGGTEPLEALNHSAIQVGGEGLHQSQNL